MKDVAIRVSGVSKTYRMWTRPGMRLTAPAARRAARSPVCPVFLKKRLEGYFQRACYEFYALKDVSFEVEPGETLGIVGRNGSGKSTLLQIITGILQPSAGEASVSGRAAALLELGSGFNPQFTGRENIYLNGAVMGLSRAQITEKFAEIAAFADIGKFIEQPVKTYSSGMMVRLAFAVQAAVEPKILIIDEALSVGDETFQRKCFARLEKARAKGTTILFVSHALNAVVKLCQRALWLHQGGIVMSGSPKFVTERYQKFCHASKEQAPAMLERMRAEGKHPPAEQQAAPRPQKEHAVADAPPAGSGEALFDSALVPQSTISYETLGAEIYDTAMTNAEGRKVNILKRRGVYTYSYRARFVKDCENVCFAMVIKTVDGTELGGARANPGGEKLEHVPEGSVFKVSFRFRCLLTPGLYFLNSGVEGAVGEHDSFYAHRVVDAYSFKVLEEQNLIPTATVDFLIEPSCQSCPPS